jgi:bacterioferritin-associated ferredoxin
MIVCICHRVSDRDIVREAQAGCASFDDLQESLRVGTACGACLDCAHETFHAAAGAAGCAGQHRVAMPISRHAPAAAAMPA